MKQKTKTDSTDGYIGKRLFAERRTRHISPAGLVRLLPQRMTARQIRQYEKAESSIAASRLYGVAEFFGVPVGSFFPPQEFAQMDLSEHERSLVEHFRRLPPALQFALLTLVRK